MSRAEKIFRIHVSLSESSGVYRIIDIPSGEFFHSLHLAILTAFNFDYSQLASFYLSNKNWKKGKEITLMDMGDEHELPTMDNVKLEDLISKKGQRLVYVYDFVLMWTFILELTRIHNREEGKKYPLLVEEKGEAPRQYGEIDRYPDEFSDEDQRLINELRREGKLKYPGERKPGKRNYLN